MKKKQLKPADVKRMAKVFKALSNENRLELFLEILRVHETCFETECTDCMITDIMDTLNIGAPTVSHHIKELSNAGLVVTERKGKFLAARISNDVIREVIEVLTTRE